MKTKLFLAIIVIAMVITVFTQTSVKAANGPSGEYSWVFLEGQDDTLVVFNTVGEENDVIEGVSYDEATNTVTLTDYKAVRLLNANEMGDDFTVKLVGENSLVGILIWGFGYGGSLNIIGDGSLTLNQDLLWDQAMMFQAESTNAVLSIANTATVKMYADESVIVMMATKANGITNAISLKNGQDISANVVKENYNYPQYSQGIYFEDEYHNDYTIYTKDGKKYGLDDYNWDDKYHVTCSPIVYDEVTEKYFVDRSFTLDPEEYRWNFDFNSLDEVIAAGYTATEEHVTTTSVTGIDGGSPVYEDGNGKRYVVQQWWNEDIMNYKFFEISDRTMVLTDGEAYPFWTLTEAVQIDDLTQVYEDVEGLYNYYVNMKELTINAGEAPAEEPAEEPAKEIIVEAAEDTVIDNLAAAAVQKIATDIVEEKEVNGISDELKGKIAQAINEGKTITVEVTAPEANAEEVKEDVQKIEEKLPEGSKIATLYNVEVVVKIDGEVAGNVTETGEKLKLVLPVPKDLPAVPAGYRRVFTIYKVHNGVAVALETTQENDELSAESSEYSTYAVTYEDVKTTKNPSTGDNIYVYIAIFAVSVLGMAVIAKSQKRK